jgi:tetratricopeptide (TPR) repeat protein
LLALSGVGYAQQDDVDTEVARRHFQKGSQFYSSGDYSAALREFDAARRAYASPAIDYNIARCHDRLENLPAAVEYYERYLATAKDAPDAAEIARRVEVLRQRIGDQKPAIEAKPSPPTPSPVAAPAPAPLPPKKKHTWAIVGGVLGGVVVIAVAAGLAVGLTAAPSYSSSALGPIQSTP